MGGRSAGALPLVDVYLRSNLLGAGCWVLGKVRECVSEREREGEREPEQGAVVGVVGVVVCCAAVLCLVCRALLSVLLLCSVVSRACWLVAYPPGSVPPLRPPSPPHPLLCPALPCPALPCPTAFHQAGLPRPTPSLLLWLLY